MEIAATAQATHGHPGRRYWVIAGLALAWAIFGCADCALTVMRISAYLIALPRDMIDWLDSMPTWTVLPWALGTGAALLGALCLLARSRHAVTWFAWSLVGLVVLQGWELSFGLPPTLKAPASLAMGALVWIAALGLLWFSVRKRGQGVLR